MTEKKEIITDEIVEKTIKEVEQELEEEKTSNPLLGTSQQVFTEVQLNDGDDLQLNITNKKIRRERFINGTLRCLVLIIMTIAPWLLFVLNSLVVIFVLFFFETYTTQQTIPWYEYFVIITIMFVSLLIINIPTCIILIFCGKIFK
jgi:hypothetical protein